MCPVVLGRPGSWNSPWGVPPDSCWPCCTCRPHGSHNLRLCSRASLCLALIAFLRCYLGHDKSRGRWHVRAAQQPSKVVRHGRPCRSERAIKNNLSPSVTFCFCCLRPWSLLAPLKKRPACHRSLVQSSILQLGYCKNALTRARVNRLSVEIYTCASAHGAHLSALPVGD